MSLSVADAAHKTVYAAGGSKVVANSMGMSDSVLRAKVNPFDKSRWLYLPEAVELMSLTGDHRILDALADEFGYQLRQISESDDSGRALVTLVSDAVFGEVSESDIRRSVAFLGSKAVDMRPTILAIQELLAKLEKVIERD